MLTGFFVNKNYFGIFMRNFWGCVLREKISVTSRIIALIGLFELVGERDSLGGLSFDSEASATVDYAPAVRAESGLVQSHCISPISLMWGLSVRR